MQNEGSNETSTRAGDHSGNLTEPDLEKQGNIPVLPQEERQPGSVGDSAYEANPTLLTIVVTKGKSHVTQQPIVKLSKDVDSIKEELPRVASPKKGIFRGPLVLMSNAASHTHAYVDSQICFVVQTNYWVWRVDPSFTPHDRERGCFSPLWVAFSILIGGLLLDALISITLGVSALPVNIIIGVIVFLVRGTAIRLALEFCHEWSNRRAVHRVETNATLGYHPAL
ncbi:hypothetical protein CRYUN_Cryun13aG0099100 [Craigia yunnanensis]